MPNSLPSLVLISTVGLTPRLLAFAPRLSALAEKQWQATLREPLPAVMPTAQATLLTGQLPRRHGIVSSGWLFRDTGEVRFWQQSNRLLQAEPFYVTARRRAAHRGLPWSAAKLFWWFNQGAAVDFSVTPKPHYGANGDKRFAIAGSPSGITTELEAAHGKFPFPAFWGPKAGLSSTRWIAQAAATVLRRHRPNLALVYLPHLDYDLQRFDPRGGKAEAAVRELDRTVEPLLTAALQVGAKVWIVNEYSHRPVNLPVFPNRILRQAGLLKVRAGPFGETLDTFASDAFAVCDHQLAHVYVNLADGDAKRRRAAELLATQPGVAQVMLREQLEIVGLDHERSGELVLVAEPTAWFAYPYWLENKDAPDFARCVDIHRKPGFDPCELFFDPKLPWPMGRMMWRLIQKNLGFRTLFDVVPLDATLVRGSHGLAAGSAEDRPLLLGTGPRPRLDADGSLPMKEVADLVLQALGLPE